VTAGEIHHRAAAGHVVGLTITPVDCACCGDLQQVHVDDLGWVACVHCAPPERLRPFIRGWNGCPTSGCPYEMAPA